MKLLLTRTCRLLVGRFAEEFPDTAHVTDVGLDPATNREAWEFARAGGHVIVSKDSDFLQLAFLFGPLQGRVAARRDPSTDLIVSLLRDSIDVLAAFAAGGDERASVLRACNRAREGSRRCEVRHSDVSVVYRCEPW